MLKILNPGLRFDIHHASTSLPSHGPIHNVDILKQFPRMQDKSEQFINKFAAKIADDFGFSKRYWSHLPWEPLELSREEHSESLSSKAVDVLLTHLPKENIDAFILGSTTNKRYTGSQACAVMGKHQLEVPAWDMKAGCSTSLASLQLAYSLMSLGYQNVLVSCAETLSKVIDPENELTYFGLADGAAAVLLQANSQGAFHTDKLCFSSKGQYVDGFTTPGLLPPTDYEINLHGYALKGDEELLKKLAYEYYSKMLNELLVDVDVNEIKWIIAHQVNRKLIESLIQEYDLKNAELIWHGDEVGNIGGASILYSLAEAIKSGTFQQNGKILMMSVGGGLTYAAQLLDYRC